MLYVKSVIILIAIMASQMLYSQAAASVLAKSGLTVRKAPSRDAEIVGKLAFRAVVSLGSDFGDSLQITDGNKIIKGRWQRIYAEKQKLSGFVFDGYLLEGADLSYESWCDKNNTPCQTNYYGHGFLATLYDYEAHADPAKGDTIFSWEEVGVNIEAKLFEVVPENSEDSVVVYYTLIESLYPLNASKPSNMSYEKFHLKNPSWKGSRPYKRIVGKQNFYRIPQPSYAMMEGWRKRDLGFGDTLVGYSSEGGYIEATASKNNVPYVYLMQDALIKVVLFREGKKYKITYLKANFTYGC